MKWLKHTFRCIYTCTDTVYNQNEHELDGDGRHFNQKKNFVNDTESTGEIHFPFFMFATENVSYILSCMIEWKKYFRIILCFPLYYFSTSI